MLLRDRTRSEHRTQPRHPTHDGIGINSQRVRGPHISSSSLHRRPMQPIPQERRPYTPGPGPDTAPGRECRSATKPNHDDSNDCSASNPSRTPSRAQTSDRDHNTALLQLPNRRTDRGQRAQHPIIHGVTTETLGAEARLPIHD
jgi:hypothetical protein